MPLIQHKELLRQALQYVMEQKKEGNTPLSVLLDEAGMRFNLSPLDQESLERLIREREV